jgi:hypothetical protein
MPKFDINEYVWDRTRDGPGVVVGYDPLLPLPYTVAEINEQRKLGRVGYRSDEALCRYVRLIVPEDEAQFLLAWATNNPIGERANPRIRDALEKRGIEPEY